jgi:S1-C subfamily serine protease
VDNLVRYGRVLRLGIMGTELTPGTAKQIQAETGVKVTVKEGIFVADVQSGSAADKAGIQPGDIITSAAGKTVRVMRDLTTLVRRAHPGERIDLIVVRKGREMRIRVLLV